jgi:hypothetical protein
VEGDVTFDALNDLMDVAVQHRDGPEATQVLHELIRVAGAPAPRLIDGPERHVGEDHNRRAGGAAFEVRGHPGELIGAQSTEALRLELQYVDQRDEVHTGVIKAVIALVGRRLAEAIEIFGDGRIGVVLAPDGFIPGCSSTLH